jgi:hypothetical protein
MTFEEFLQKSPLATLWSMSERLDEIYNMLQTLTANEETMAQTAQKTAQDILDKVAEVKDRTDAENALLDELHSMLKDAQTAGDPALMQQAIDKLDEIRQGAADAIVRNTPDAGSSTGAVTTSTTGAADTGGVDTTGTPATGTGDAATP